MSEPAREGGLGLRVSRSDSLPRASARGGPLSATQLFWPALRAFPTIPIRRRFPMPRCALANTGFLSLVFVSLAMAAGCGKSPADQLAGNWVGDRIDNVSADDVGPATARGNGQSLWFFG